MQSGKNTTVRWPGDYVFAARLSRNRGKSLAAGVLRRRRRSGAAVCAAFFTVSFALDGPAHIYRVLRAAGAE